MKKILSIVLIIVLVIILPACSHFLDPKTKEEKEAAFLNDIIPTSEVDDTTSTTKNSNITHKDIEKVKIVCMDAVEEYTEEEHSFDFIESIKNCNTIPKTSLTMDVGYIQIKYVGKDEPEEFAKLYLGLDGKIYAKYYKNIESEFAYKFN